VRAAKIAKDRGIGGSVDPASTYLMKSPRRQVNDDQGRKDLEVFIAGEDGADLQQDVTESLARL
jgi:myo-inositol-1-phosphate synthase